jgi:predicted nucleic acid-binding protein
VNLYIDSSVLLRVVLRERNALAEWSRSSRWISSKLIRVECLRTIDRLRHRFSLDDSATADRLGLVHDLLDGFTFVPVDDRILQRASEPFPTALGSLDALHLASALAARSAISDLVFATHDRELGLAARSVGFDVLGVPALA